MLPAWGPLCKPGLIPGLQHPCHPTTLIFAFKFLLHLKSSCPLMIQSLLILPHRQFSEKTAPGTPIPPLLPSPGLWGTCCLRVQAICLPSLWANQTTLAEREAHQRPTTVALRGTDVMCGQPCFSEPRQPSGVHRPQGRSTESSQSLCLLSDPGFREPRHSLRKPGESQTAKVGESTCSRQDDAMTISRCTAMRGSLLVELAQP